LEWVVVYYIQTENNPEEIMAYATKIVEVDIDLDDFDDDAIYEEFHDRGLMAEDDEMNDFYSKMDHIKWEWEFGNKQEALKLLEQLTELKGLSTLVV
jgi:hypothetical protein